MSQRPSRPANRNGLKITPNPILTKRRIPQWEDWAKMQNASDRLHVQSTADKPGDISSLGGQSQIQQPADTMKQNGNIITQEFPLESIKTSLSFQEPSLALSKRQLTRSIHFVDFDKPESGKPSNSINTTQQALPSKVFGKEHPLTMSFIPSVSQNSLASCIPDALKKLPKKYYSHQLNISKTPALPSRLDSKSPQIVYVSTQASDSGSNNNTALKNPDTGSVKPIKSKNIDSLVAPPTKPIKHHSKKAELPFNNSNRSVTKQNTALPRIKPDTKQKSLLKSKDGQPTTTPAPKQLPVKETKIDSLSLSKTFRGSMHFKPRPLLSVRKPSKHQLPQDLNQSQISKLKTHMDMTRRQAVFQADMKGRLAQRIGLLKTKLEMTTAVTNDQVDTASQSPKSVSSDEDHEESDIDELLAVRDGEDDDDDESVFELSKTYSAQCSKDESKQSREAEDKAPNTNTFENLSNVLEKVAANMMLQETSFDSNGSQKENQDATLFKQNIQESEDMNTRPAFHQTEANPDRKPSIKPNILDPRVGQKIVAAHPVKQEIDETDNTLKPKTNPNPLTSLTESQLNLLGDTTGAFRGPGDVYARFLMGGRNLRVGARKALAAAIHATETGQMDEFLIDKNPSRFAVVSKNSRSMGRLRKKHKEMLKQKMLDKVQALEESRVYIITHMASLNTYHKSMLDLKNENTKLKAEYENVVADINRRVSSTLLKNEESDSMIKRLQRERNVQRKRLAKAYATLIRSGNESIQAKETKLEETKNRYNQQVQEHIDLKEFKASTEINMTFLDPEVIAKRVAAEYERKEQMLLEYQRLQMEYQEKFKIEEREAEQIVINRIMQIIDDAKTELSSFINKATTTAYRENQRLKMEIQIQEEHKLQFAKQISNFEQKQKQLILDQSKYVDERRRVLNLKECMTCTPDMDVTITSTKYGQEQPIDKAPIKEPILQTVK
ncbi:hypothetical protein BDEG_21306 [Batrachochytrium dendrobatidis JEL423]|uniref:Uncharacterized protein n=1 Tax=Batrachochytrium dendrobatidis (strain JEL423) TaxID=403673 RepID=A0A177WD19_BATDL|nr:hypothetical protein BDEG_21306 [Batrachochytrium dendrobatidis JEL423]